MYKPSKQTFIMEDIQEKYKCADYPNRHFAPLAYQDLYRHLEGKDENCCDAVERVGSYWNRSSHYHDSK